MQLRYIVLAVAFLCLPLCNSSSVAATGYNSRFDGFILSTATTPPVAIAKPVDSLTQTTVRLNGQINPQGATTTYRFLYGLTTAYGDTTTQQNLTNLTGDNPVHAKVTGLAPLTQYHFAVLAINGGGSDTSNDLTFTTLPNPPQLLDLYTTAVDRNSAIFIANVTTNAPNGKAVFHYGTDSTLSLSSDTISITSGSSSFPSWSAYGLQSNYNYYYSVTIMTAAGVFSGPVKNFATLSSVLEYQPDDHTVALYHFNGAVENPVVDYSGKKHNGSTNAPVIPGIYGNALSFDPSVDQLYIPDNDSSLSFPTANFTVEAWIRPNGYYPGFIPLINKGSFTNHDGSWALRIDQDKNIYLDISTDGSNVDYEIFTVDSPVQDHTWNHIGVIIDSANQDANIYVNGSLTTCGQAGLFPTGAVFKSPAQVHIGSGAIAASARTVAGSAAIEIDEVRISDLARDPKEFTQIRNSLRGTVFNDVDGDGTFSAPDITLAGWGVSLYAAGDASGVPLLTTVTDYTGTYRFDGLVDGNYVVTEADSDNWIRTLPVSGKYRLSLSGPVTIDNLNFGNLSGCRYLGGPVGDPGSWSCGHVPGSAEGLIIPTSGTITELPTDSVAGLRVNSNTSFTYGVNGGLKIAGSVVVDEGGTLAFDSSAADAGLIVYGNFDNGGTMDGGHSTVTFAGDRPKVISYSGSEAGSAAPVASPKAGFPRKANAAVLGNSFYNLVINGAGTSTQGNIAVSNQLILNNDLDARPQDTIFITAQDPSSLIGGGLIPRGTVSRSIQNGASGAYRFESDLSSVDFTGSGSYPASMLQTPSPDTVPHAWQLYWEPVGGTVNLTDHTVTATGVDHFSKWIVGKPGGGIKPLTIPGILAVQSLQTGFDSTSAVKRMYQITVDANNGSFDAALALRYDPSELNGLLDESELELFRGPFVVNSLAQGWNLVSLPVAPENASVASLFPTAVSSAYSYNVGYLNAPSLTPGTGYWLKLPAELPDTMMGGDFDNLSIGVAQGWNLIGALSYPASAGEAYSPDGVTFGPFYGYNHGYFAASSLEPLHGYWVKADQAGHITLTAPAPGAAAPVAGQRRDATQAALFNNTLGALSTVTISDAAGNAQTLYFGTAPKTLDLSALMMPPAPPAGVLDARFRNGAIAALAPADGRVTSSLDISNAVYPVTVSWNAKSGAAGSVEVNGSGAGSLAGSGSFTIGQASSVVLRVNGGAAADDGLPKSFALYQNYPNPFNPQTTIRFDLAADARVSLAVFNTLGQQVASLADNLPFPAGAHQLPFNGSALGSGVYYYRISTSTGFTAVRSMLIIK